MGLHLSTHSCTLWIERPEVNSPTPSLVGGYGIHKVTGPARIGPMSLDALATDLVEIQHINVTIFSPEHLERFSALVLSRIFQVVHS